MLTLHPAEQEVIAVIRRLRRTVLSARRIIDELDRLALKPKHARRWHVKVVLDLCQREEGV